MPIYQSIGVFGGTFDPVHNAHLRVALDVLEQLKLSQVRFVPSHRPPHRAQPGASPEQRLSMLKLALKQQNGFTIDTRELERDGPSYMVDTLRSLRTEYPERSLCLILGSDAFHDFNTWYQWRIIIQLAHIIVLQRPNQTASQKSYLADDLTELLAQHQVDNAAFLHNQTHGGIVSLAVTQLTISASTIRTLLAQGRSPRYLLPDTVYEFIHQQQLYK